MKQILNILLLLSTVILYPQKNNEAVEIKENKEFDKAMHIMTIKSMDDFMISYPNSKLKERATEIRDSLALPEMGSGYYKFLEYVNNYPNSKYSSDIIKGLPDTLYHEAMVSSSFQSVIMLLKLLIATYPSASVIGEAKTNLEIYYARSINNKFDMEEYKEFKRLFPESRFYFDKTSKKMRPRSDGKYSISAP